MSHDRGRKAWDALSALAAPSSLTKEVKMDELQELKDQIAEIVKQNEDLIAERDSLLEENQKLKETEAATRQELADTKKLNFTLGRRLSVEPSESVEEMLNKLF